MKTIINTIKAAYNAATAKEVLHDFDQCIYDKGVLDVAYIEELAHTTDTITLATHGSIPEHKIAMVREYIPNVSVVQVDVLYVCEDSKNGYTELIIDEATMQASGNRYLPVCDERTCMPMIIKLIGKNQILVDNHAELYAKYATTGTYIKKEWIV